MPKVSEVAKAAGVREDRALSLLKASDKYKNSVSSSSSDVKRIPISKPVTNSTAKSDVLFNVGDKISHKAFGNGIVVYVAGDLITVAFSAEYGIKKLKANHPAIRKL